MNFVVTLLLQLSFGSKMEGGGGKRMVSVADCEPNVMGSIPDRGGIFISSVLTFV